MSPDTIMGAPGTATGIAPPAGGERIAFLDVLRRVAVPGVLILYTLWNPGSPPAGSWSVADHAINHIGELLIDTKFFTIFAFLVRLRAVVLGLAAGAGQIPPGVWWLGRHARGLLESVRRRVTYSSRARVRPVAVTAE